jgi:hypothetical protein
MNDLSNFIPMIAEHVGLSPSTLVFLFFCINQGAKAAGRVIPNDATGWLATLRTICGFLGADPSSRVTSGVSVEDVAKQALTTPPISEKVAAVARADGTNVSEPTSPPAAI